METDSSLTCLVTLSGLEPIRQTAEILYFKGFQRLLSQFCPKKNSILIEVDSNLDDAFSTPLFIRDSSIIRHSFAKLKLSYTYGKCKEFLFIFFHAKRLEYYPHTFKIA